MLRRLVPLLAFLALLGAACGDDGGGEDESAGDEASGDDAGGGGPCDLLEQAQVEELLGQAVEDGEVEEFEGGTTCTWATVEDSASEEVGRPIELSVERGELTDDIRTAVEEVVDQGGHETLDLGDLSVHICQFESDVGPGCDTFDEVIVFVGDDYLEVDLGNWAYPADFEQEEGVEITREAAAQATEAVSS